MSPISISVARNQHAYHGTWCAGEFVNVFAIGDIFNDFHMAKNYKMAEGRIPVDLKHSITLQSTDTYSPCKNTATA